MPKFKVLVGNVDFLTCEGCVKQVPLVIQNHTISLSAFVLPISGAQVILGASWLATLGSHVADYSQLTIKYYAGSKFVTLKVFTLHPQEVNPNDDPFVALDPSPHSEILALLHQFIGIFHKPRGLPPVRSYDHAIPLIPMAAPVKVRSYRYPFSYKAEIERIVQELL
uniref:Uncharacterized protein n=1 Tax=Cajanus cajan TaxID=3821 RepID=A0A151QNU9_CAJCA|nr:hypothetical protein KK1_047513 [Cajanus cajan]